MPRHQFVPPTGWACPNHDATNGRAIDRGTDPAAWWQAVYSDTSIVTQTDDGNARP